MSTNVHCLKIKKHNKTFTSQGFKNKNSKSQNLEDVKGDLQNENQNLGQQIKINFMNKYRTLDLGSYKLFFTYENNQLVYKFI